LLLYKNIKLRRRKRLVETGKIQRGRQGASSKRANSDLAEFGRIWQDLAGFGRIWQDAQKVAGDMPQHRHTMLPILQQKL